MKCCDRCGVWFLTGYGNRKRTDVCCAFGCREETRREKTNERGRRHYRTAKGRVDKSRRNRERSLVSAEQPTQERVTAVGPSPPDGFVFSPEVLRHIAYVLLLASGYKPSIGEIEYFLNEVMTAVMIVLGPAILRQRSLPERGG
jgi:hypothetical protein